MYTFKTIYIEPTVQIITPSSVPDLFIRPLMRMEITQVVRMASSYWPENENFRRSFIGTLA